MGLGVSYVDNWVISMWLILSERYKGKKWITLWFQKWLIVLGNISELWRRWETSLNVWQRRPNFKSYSPSWFPESEFLNVPWGSVFLADFPKEQICLGAASPVQTFVLQMSTLRVWVSFVVVIGFVGIRAKSRILASCIHVQFLFMS